MRKSKRMLLGLMGSILLSSAVAEESHALVIHATGFQNGHGQAIAKLFEAGDVVMGPGRLQVATAIENGQARLAFANLPAGRYAIVVFHDENSNGQIDHNVLRMPSEALGFSNGFTLGLLSGLPTFERLAFQHGVDTRILEIAIK